MINSDDVTGKAKMRKIHVGYKFVTIHKEQ